MSRNSDVTRSGDLDSLPSWISDHLGEGSSFMIDEINQSLSSPMEGSPEASPLIAIYPSVEEKTNIMTLEELNTLRDTYSFPLGVRIRLPDEGETITSTRPGEVAFYEAAFPAGLRFFLHPTIRLILQLYNICPAQLVPNAWRSIDCSMALWRARNKKVLLRGYPINVKGWKSKFFFISGDEWEIPEGTSREGAPRVPRTWRILDKHCNNPPRLYGDEPKVFEEIFWSIEKTGRFSVPVLLDSKSYRRVFVSPGSRASRTAGDNLPSREIHRTPRAMWDRTEEDVTSYSRPDPFEVVGEKGSGSYTRPFYECSELELELESLIRILFGFEPTSMSKRISFKKIDEKLGKSANVSLGTPIQAKGVVIGEKRTGESITRSPSKKGKADDGSKGKRVDRGPEGKKKATSSSKAPATLAAPSSRPREGTSANLADKEKVEKLTLDQTEKKLFHVISQALVLGSSLAIRSREAREQASLQEGRVASMEIELAKMKSDRDSLADKLERSGVLVNELREALDKAKESTVEEFKSSSEFVVAVEDSAFKYFGEGFDFCKV
ncbi:hypothetical protein Acr_28g0003170 [Actinidia rufa]|uniref:Transposase (Putative), gypsy type n=1 Tax=Actinidia rufa TaxID=165716 RepID=A0A7J0H925_9ERIC|nr:hypothetical protein Acr_28g0003170 [Actinidia rufa]